LGGPRHRHGTPWFVAEPAPAPTPGPRLLARLHEAIRVRHLSRRTEEAYRHWIRRYLFFHHLRHPSEMGEAEINTFLTHLAVQEKVSASTQNQALLALLFLYRQVIGREVGELGEVIRARKPKRLPVVMTREEVKAVLANLSGDKWLMASLLYGAGLRLMECLRLRVQDIDFSRNEILVRDGKGGKDRVTLLPESLKAPLQEHLKRVQAVHERDLADGWGRVPLPDALEQLQIQSRSHTLYSRLTQRDGKWTLLGAYQSNPQDVVLDQHRGSFELILTDEEVEGLYWNERWSRGTLSFTERQPRFAATLGAAKRMFGDEEE
jgi:integrase